MTNTIYRRVNNPNKENAFLTNSKHGLIEVIIDKNKISYKLNHQTNRIISSTIGKNFSKTLSLYDTRLKGNQRGSFFSKLKAALVQSANLTVNEADLENKIDTIFEEINKYISECEEISSHYISREKGVEIFLTKTGIIKYNKTDVSVDTNKIFAEYSKIATRAKSTLSNKERREHSKTLYNCLCNAIRLNSEKEFISYQEIVDQKWLARSRLHNGISAIIPCISFFIIYLLITLDVLTQALQAEDKIIIQVICCGIFGASISIVQRNPEFTTNCFTPLYYFYINTIGKLLLGSIFGYIALLMINSGIVFSFAKNNIEITILIAIMSGMSERLIPDALGKISTQ